MTIIIQAACYDSIAISGVAGKFHQLEGPRSLTKSYSFVIAIVLCQCHMEQSAMRGRRTLLYFGITMQHLKGMTQLGQCYTLMQHRAQGTSSM